MAQVIVNLTHQTMSHLEEAAHRVDMPLETMFEYTVRNTLKVYHVIDSTGFIRLINEETGEFRDIYFQDDSPYPSPWTRIVSTILGSKKRRTPEFQPFDAFLQDTTVEDVALQAGIFGLTRTDLYNQLVTVGSRLACHPDSAYAFTKAGAPLGEIDFTTL